LKKPVFFAITVSLIKGEAKEAIESRSQQTILTAHSFIHSESSRLLSPFPAAAATN